MDMAAVIGRSDDVIARSIGDEVLLVPVTKGGGDLENIFSLNAVGAFVWEAADGKRSVQEIVDGVVAEFEVERSVAESDVEAFLGEMEVAGLMSRRAVPVSP